MFFFATMIVQTFKEQLTLFDEVIEKLKDNETKCVIFLDSIDQLAPDDGAYLMKWLPRGLPPRIKIVVSALPDEKYGIVSSLKVFYF